MSALAILTYHSLDDSGSVLSTPPSVFAEQMRILRESDVSVVPLGTIGDALRDRNPFKPLVAITFDDGFMSVHKHGLPILLRYGLPATVFLVTDYCGKTNDWPSQPHWVNRQPLLGWTEAREMSRAGMAFGSHTRTHSDLRMLPSHQIEEELVTSKRAIEDGLGRSVDIFAYPYGAYDERVRKISESFFSLACSTRLDFVRAGSDPLVLERLDMYYLRRPMAFRHLFSGGMDRYIRFRRIMQNLRGRMRRWN